MTSSSCGMMCMYKGIEQATLSSVLFIWRLLSHFLPNITSLLSLAASSTDSSPETEHASVKLRNPWFAQESCNPSIARAKLGSMLRAAQSTDCTDRRFAHNILVSSNNYLLVISF